MPAADVDVVTTVLEGGKKKVIKRVKVVKKVVKRVIKRVPKGSLKSLESESVSNVGNLNENVQNLESRLNVSEAMEIEKVDPSAIVSIEYQKFEPNDIAPLEVENECSKEIKVDSPQYGNISPFLEPVSPVGIVDPSAIVSLEYEKFEPNDIAPLGVENGGSKEIEVDSKKFGNISPFLEPVSPIGTLSEVPFIYNNDGNEGEGVENQIEDDKDHVHVDAVEDQIAAAREEGASEVEDFATEPVQNNSSGLSGVVALSGELEAVERRRRRQTEIFLGGLDKGAKEEDIRRVFERVGEVTEVRLLIDGKTGKNKGFAFVQFASANDAKKALATYPNVEICGKQCGTRPVEGNDTIFLGNINRKWKDDDVLRLLKDAGIERIYKVSIKANPKNIEQNRGFAFLELETSRDAQTAFNKLQKNDLLVKQMKIKVAWAEPLAEPDENEMLKVKSIYAEYLPTLWDEEKVKTFFKRFGEIESVSLSKNRPSSRRKDIAFVNYKSREAALACIKAFSHEQVDEDGSKLNVKVALANPQKRSKQVKHVSDSTGKELHKSKAKTPELGKRGGKLRKKEQTILKFHQPTNYARATSRSNEVISEGTNSITNELICLLRQQASGRLMQAGSSDLNHHHSPSGSKRTVHQLGNYPLSSDPRGFPRIRLESSQLTGNRRIIKWDSGLSSFSELAGGEGVSTGVCGVIGVIGGMRAIGTGAGAKLLMTLMASFCLRKKNSNGSKKRKNDHSSFLKPLMFEVGDGEMWVLGMGWIFSFCSFELMETYPLKRNKHKEG
ncbi:hypothetical protein M9H77_14841 [Catharanthus roseus]|uniref:Uncharacterized protein n=1 Tax=Catharanthus roseus TaxID=4058 RepID=A0ACC0BPF3_CATRO|nr:hypothetical protein M9H77_14841 [Catharanthus roseus]